MRLTVNLGTLYLRQVLEPRSWLLSFMICRIVCSFMTKTTYTNPILNTTFFFKNLHHTRRGKMMLLTI